MWNEIISLFSAKPISYLEAYAYIGFSTYQEKLLEHKGMKSFKIKIIGPQVLKKCCKDRTIYGSWIHTFSSTASFLDV